MIRVPPSCCSQNLDATQLDLIPYAPIGSNRPYVPQQFHTKDPETPTGYISPISSVPFHPLSPSFIEPNFSLSSSLCTSLPLLSPSLRFSLSLVPIHKIPHHISERFVPPRDKHHIICRDRCASCVPRERLEVLRYVFFVFVSSLGKERANTKGKKAYQSAPKPSQSWHR